MCKGDLRKIKITYSHFFATGRVIRVSWADSPLKRDPGVGFCGPISLLRFRLNEWSGACFPRPPAGSAVGESEFMGFKAPRGRSVHNSGIPIHNSWDKKGRSLWDSSIIYGTEWGPRRRGASAQLVGPPRSPSSSGTVSSGRPQEQPWCCVSARPRPSGQG